MRRLFSITWNWIKTLMGLGDEKPYPNADYEFVTLGIQYYIAARSSALAKSIPVTGNQFHHTVEMLLKARLAKTHSLRKLRHFGHNLVRLWRKFKKDFPTEDFSPFNQLIKELHKFESIRYPGDKPKAGLNMAIEWDGERTKVWGKDGRELCIFRCRVAELDALFVRLMQLIPANIVPYMAWVNPFGIRVLEENNAFCEGWFHDRERRLGL